jgi:hypothetical protein
MTKEQTFFIDLVNAIPDNTHWSFHCYADEFYATLLGIPLVTERATIGIAFRDAFRSQIAGLTIDDLFERINFLEVSQNGQKLLEAFDGFVIVTLSKSFPLAGTALSQYLDQDLLFVSDNW